MNNYRLVPFLTCEVFPYKKVKINLSGCNFECRGCFALAKNNIGRPFSVDALVSLLFKSCCLIYGGMVDDVQLTGGEPIIEQDYLLSLIQKLKSLGVNKVGISTNGYMLNEDLVSKLSFLVDYIKLDLKAYTEEIHEWYTSKSNFNVLKAVELLCKYGLNFYVRTIVIPGIIDVFEVEKIAKFLSSINKNIHYRLYQFAPEQLKNKFSRVPTENEMLKAYEVSKKYLNNVEFFVYKTTKTSVYKTAYDPNYEFIEVRADELSENFKKIDEIAKSVDEGWNPRYVTMDQVLLR